jgi:hypothetical protein
MRIMNGDITEADVVHVDGSMVDRVTSLRISAEKPSVARKITGTLTLSIPKLYGLSISPTRRPQHSVAYVPRQSGGTELYL